MKPAPPPTKEVSTSMGDSQPSLHSGLDHLKKQTCTRYLFATFLVFLIVIGVYALLELTTTENITITLPWLTGLFFLVVLFFIQIAHTPTNDLVSRLGHTTAICFAWVTMFALLIALLSLNRDMEQKGAADLLAGSWNRAWRAAANVMGFTMPFMIYPTIVYWLKHNTDKMFEKDRRLSHEDEAESQTFHQSNLITYTIKSLVIVLVVFSVLNNVGVETDSILQITTVFSLGLSWSMRDWLSSMWGCFILAFSTKLCKKTYLRLTGDQHWLQVRRPGIIFVVCQKIGNDESDERIYVPNASLMTRGFSTCSTFPPLKG